ncbi:rod-binding protein [Thalassovita sp.]|uniref:rod-binding protein n=1 Tax=Thalassovita sp. TaxID=1979401 RepID=UPI003B5C63B8
MTDIPLVSQTSPQRTQALREAAQKIEASFLSEMLKAAGVGKASETFGGGIGEEQFASFLRDAQAQEMVRAGGIGLAESLFQSLKEKDNAGQ